MKKENEAENEPAPNEPAEAIPGEIEELRGLRAENDTLKADLRLANARAGLTVSLAKAGARTPHLLFESIKNALQFTDDGSLANGAEIVEKLTRQFPEQFGVDPVPGTIDAGAGRVQGPALTKAALAKMKPAEIAALDWGEVRQALSV